MKKASYKTELMRNPTREPLLVVLSGPSGAGKDAVLAKLKKSGQPFESIVTVTTRPRRPKERDSIDYHFISVKEFQELIGHEELLEWANVYGNWYGVPRKPVKQALDRGQDIIVKVDVQGAATIKKAMPQAVLIFLIPPLMKELGTRLNQRHTESSSALSLRTGIAAEEIKQLPLFDYMVVNKQDEINRAVSDIKAIIQAEGCRVNPRRIAL